MIDSECVALRRWGGLPVVTVPGQDFEEMADWPGGVEIPADVEAWAWRVEVADSTAWATCDLFDAFLREWTPPPPGSGVHRRQLGHRR